MKKKKELEIWTRSFNTAMIGAVMYSCAAVGVTWYAKEKYEDYLIPDKYIKKIMARFKKLHKLEDYNERLKGFIEEISKISIECNKNDYGDTTSLKRHIKSLKDNETKSSFETQKTPFVLIGNKSYPVCDDYTIVFGTIAQSLNLHCANLLMLPDENSDISSHSVLLLAKMKNPVTDPNTPWDWVCFDGRNFSNDDLGKGFKNIDGTIPINHIDDVWEVYKGGKKYININMLSSYADDFEYVYPIYDKDIQNLERGGYLLKPRFR